MASHQSLAASSSAGHRIAAVGIVLPNWFAAAVLIVATCVAYLPAMSGQFLWDDDSLLTENPLIPATDGLYRIWFTTEPIDYWPVSNSTFWIEWRLWGTNPTGYHVTNLLLHIGASLLVWAILRRLSIRGGFLAALLFAVHPVNVEAVAWIAQRKTLLALVFFLLSILWYLKADPPSATPAVQRLYAPGAGRWYWLSLVAFVLGMLSKGSIAILPLDLLGIVWWNRNQITRWDFARVAPFFLAAVPLVLVNIWFQTHGSGEVIRSASLTERLAGAGVAIWFYLFKALLPLNLMFIYPQWEIDASNPRWWIPLVAVLALTVALWWKRHTGWGRALLFAWAFFCVALLPVLGFTDVYFMKYSLVADHYQNIAVIAVVALVAAAWNVWFRETRSLARAAALGVAALAVSASVGLSRQQCQMFADLETLYRTTLEQNPRCWLVYNNLGTVLFKRGEVSEAIPLFEKALELNPNFREAHSSLGVALQKAGREQEGLDQLRQAVAISPRFGKTHYDLGTALLYAGRASEAIQELREAVRLNPELADAHSHLATALFNVGRTQEALEHFEKAVRLRPDRAEAHKNLGKALINTGRRVEATPYFERAVQLSPEDAESHNDLGAVLFNAGREREAIDQFQQAVRLKPNFVEAQSNLGNALLKSGRPQEAIEHFEQYARSNPDVISAWSNLASANAAAQHRVEAIAAGQKALELARAQGKQALAEQLEAWLAALDGRAGGLDSSAPRPTLPPGTP